ncbi:hypothetical protein NHG23_02615 [Aerococcaceae bacterium NML190073]|nr:hypothetical protein [Aerococcaceae bacterium NML190073]
MRKPDIKINDIWMSSLGRLRESIDFPTPQSQSEMITVPGRNSPIRYTEALGRVSYEPRSFEIILTMLGSREKYNAMVSATVNFLAGKLCRVTTIEEPELYAVGTIECSPVYDPLSCSDGDSYRYHTDETVIAISPATQPRPYILTNDFMPVVPVIKTTAETSFSWKVGKDSFSKTVSAGTWEFPEMELQHGDNSIVIVGTGNTTFRYWEGRL